MPKQARRLSVIMFTDIVNYSKKMQKNESRTLLLLDEHNKILDECILKFDGHVIKTIGDAFLANFTNVSDALQSAVQIQKTIKERNQTADEEDKFEIRIGIHIGDVYFTENDVFGDGVNIASRIESAAKAGEIFLSEDAYHVVKGKVDMTFHRMGRFSLKNINEPVSLYQLLWHKSQKKIAAPSTKIFTLQKKIIASIALIVSILAVGAGYGYFQLSQDAEILNAASQNRLKIVIFDFNDETPNQEFKNNASTRVITDAFETKFYQLKSLQLVSPIRLARALREEELDVNSISKSLDQAADLGISLGASIMITGKISYFSNKYKISVDVHDINTSELLNKLEYAFEDKNLILRQIIDNLFAQISEKLIATYRLEEKTAIAKISELTTDNLESYSSFIKGVDLVRHGILEPGIEKIKSAIKLDPDFGLAYSVIACTYAFGGDQVKSIEYAEKSKRFKAHFKNKTSKEALIYNGNLAWYGLRLWDVKKYYQLIIELYPDDREGYFYYGLYLEYLTKNHDLAINYFKQAQMLSPSYFPIYREMALALVKSRDKKVASTLVQNYIREYPDNHSVDFARRTIVEINTQD